MLEIGAVPAPVARLLGIRRGGASEGSRTGLLQLRRCLAVKEVSRSSFAAPARSSLRHEVGERTRTVRPASRIPDLAAPPDRRGFAVVYCLKKPPYGIYLLDGRTLRERRVTPENLSVTIRGDFDWR